MLVSIFGKTQIYCSWLYSQLRLCGYKCSIGHDSSGLESLALMLAFKQRIGRMFTRHDFLSLCIPSLFWTLLLETDLLRLFSPPKTPSAEPCKSARATSGASIGTLGGACQQTEQQLRNSPCATQNKFSESAHLFLFQLDLSRCISC